MHSDRLTVHGFHFLNISQFLWAPTNINEYVTIFTLGGL